MSKYTSADFQTARFAKHHNGSVASRRSGALWPSPWLTAASESYSDSNMADNGWVPVPDQVPGRTITESDYSDITEWARNYSNRGWEGRRVLAGAGITIVPDPEPTDAEKLADILQAAMQEDGWGDEGEANILAAALEAAGVKAPGGDDE